MTRNAKTLEEWSDYLQTLSGAKLRSKAIAANSARFVKLLEEEGYVAEEIEQIVRLFSDRFLALGEEPPGGGLFDLFAEPRPLTRR